MVAKTIWVFVFIVAAGSLSILLFYGHLGLPYKMKYGVPSHFWTTTAPFEAKLNSSSNNRTKLFYSDNFFFTPNQHTVENGMVYLKSNRLALKEATEFVKTKRVVICGSIRQAQVRNFDILRASMEVMEKVGSFFREYVILIVESDSTDTTRDFLLQWSRRNPRVQILGCGINARACSLKQYLSRDVPPGYINRKTFEDSRQASVKMALVRNIYLSHTKSAYSHYDYMAVYEMDNAGMVTWQSFPQFVSTLRQRDVDAVCALEVTSTGWVLRDPCTFVVPPIPRYIAYHMPTPQFHEFVSGVLRLARADLPLKVQSCFQALAMYRIESLIASQAVYRGPPPGLLTCEHNELAYQLSNLYLDKKFKITITKYS